MEKILVIEDDRAISDLIVLNLSLTSYETMQAFSGQEALGILLKHQFDLILMDVMLPDMDGFELMERISLKETPVIFLTARNGVTDRVKGLKLGADDYIIKPFEAVELLARIEAVLRRYNKKTVICCDDMEVNLEERTVKKEGRPVELTLKEYELLILLLRNRNKALTREKILELVWGYDYIGETRTIDIHIQKLRKKLGMEAQIKTVYKFGYRLEASV